MSAVPGVANIDPFTHPFRGSFGRFSTNTSHTLHFLTTSLRSSQLDELVAAADAFDVRLIRFEELIQRDIDQERVARMADDYLQAGSGRAVFFPPLLVCIAVLDQHGGIKDTYSSVTQQVVANPQQAYRTIFDADGFRVDLYAAQAIPLHTSQEVSVVARA